jgi:hypothetical protein
MEWINTLLSPGTLSLLIPIIAIIAAFSIAGLKAHHKHQERIEKIKHGIDPDK